MLYAGKKDGVRIQVLVPGLAIVSDVRLGERRRIYEAVLAVFGEHTGRGAWIARAAPYVQRERSRRPNSGLCPS